MKEYTLNDTGGVKGVGVHGFSHKDGRGMGGRGP